MLPDLVTVNVVLALTVTLSDAVLLIVDDEVTVADGVGVWLTLPLEVTVSVPLSDGEADFDVVHVTLGVADELVDAVGESDAVDVCESELEMVHVDDCVTLGVTLALAVSDAVALPDTVVVTVADEEGDVLEEAVTVKVGERESDALSDAVGVLVTVAVTVGLVVTLGDALSLHEGDVVADVEEVDDSLVLPLEVTVDVTVYEGDVVLDTVLL